MASPNGSVSPAPCLAALLLLIAHHHHHHHDHQHDHHCQHCTPRRSVYLYPASLPRSVTLACLSAHRPSPEAIRLSCLSSQAPSGCLILPLLSFASIHLGQHTPFFNLSLARLERPPACCCHPACAATRALLTRDLSLFLSLSLFPSLVSLLAGPLNPAAPSTTPDRDHPCPTTCLGLVQSCPT
ncbi:hypothetical protein BD289DRAFT_263588 [Coniella lustricola]|uniref:Uncharacterized protein n=1 Tax=Coniella lustricola TaxID=2025994 RepID=A0A2T3A7I7_9PEZI|nr:hypothetical protein BD289DRAFT_263588 [Coniella lustricola]